ncbi:MAG: class I SAM-dependent methyltransferase, partial [Candidatus Promineifilaceae bacterium]|nr:class I SAM-dependent methyltransferase [Candidatus Promineifilaceae bacterium]
MTKIEPRDETPPPDEARPTGAFDSTAEQAYVRAQYRTESNLATRIDIHRRYGEPAVEFTEWVLDKLHWQGTEWVLDVGCGAGSYIAPVQARAARYVAGDLSPGMLRSLPPAARLRVNLNAQHLPLADATFDVVLAAHMLYHVPGQAAAVAAFRRVLRSEGRLLVTTNSEDSMSELKALEREVAVRLGLPAPAHASLSFTLESGGSLLRRFFEHVERYDLPGALVFPDPQPVIDYLASSRQRY